MHSTQSAGCARCDKEDCGAVVIIPAVRNQLTRIDYSARTLELICPACHRFFSFPFREVEFHDVTDEQLANGFIWERSC
jgi:hypothetical protein